MQDFVIILVGTILVNNFAPVQFLGLCPFMGVSNKVESATDMAVATTFVLTLAAIASYLVNRLALILFSAMRERLAVVDVPTPFKGAAIGMITAGLMSLAFMGFAGLV